MTVENISWLISMKECCRTRRGWNQRPPDLQSDAHPTEPLRWNVKDLRCPNRLRQAKQYHRVLCKVSRFRSSCACVKYHLGLCSLLIYFVVSNDSVSGAVNALIRLCWCAVWSGSLPATHARRHVFAWCCPYNVIEIFSKRPFTCSFVFFFSVGKEVHSLCTCLPYLYNHISYYQKISSSSRWLTCRNDSQQVKRDLHQMFCWNRAFAFHKCFLEWSLCKWQKFQPTFWNIFSYFSQKTGFDISCKLSGDKLHEISNPIFKGDNLYIWNV